MNMLVVAHDPSLAELEALQTWNTVKLLGVFANDEMVVVSQIRKSKRLLIMDGAAQHEG